MSTKLYPPYIEGTLPPFCVQETRDGNNNVTNVALTIAVPYILNRAVNFSAVSQIAIKIKSIYSNAYIAYATTSSFAGGIANFSFSYNLRDGDINPFAVGQSYKIQLACVDAEDLEGYYSTVGIAKCTAEPTCTMVGNESNVFFSTYTNSDATEPLYSYQYELIDDSNNVVMTSGILLHKNEDDSPTEQHDSYMFPYEIPKGKTYTVRYTYITLNGLTGTVTTSVLPAIPLITISGLLKVAMNYDNGYVLISLDTQGSVYNGNYVLVRAERDNEDEEYHIWNDMIKINFDNEDQGGEIFRDFTVEQGKRYRYGIYKINAAGSRSERLEAAEDIIPDFEDMFLFDGERQLKIRFNPQVSSFKTNILENKSETIGGKYPFFFRNGRVAYKEFPISGLISYHMDEEELFCADSYLGLKQDLTQRTGMAARTFPDVNLRTVNLVGYNFTAERKFKLSVLDWLNDGKPKLFRSPAEGNYLVRLMGTSLTPEQSLGRLIHNFSTTAYEIGTADYNTLVSTEYNIIRVQEVYVSSLQIKTLTPTELAAKSGNVFDGLNVYGFFIDASAPGSRFQLVAGGPMITMPEKTFAIQPSEGMTFTYLQFDHPSLLAHDLSITYIYKLEGNAIDDNLNNLQYPTDILWPGYETTTEFRASSFSAVESVNIEDLTYPSYIKRIFVRKQATNVYDTIVTINGVQYSITDGTVIDVNIKCDANTLITVPTGYIYNIVYTTQVVQHRDNNKWYMR